MKEAFLHHVWEMQYFQKNSLATCEGEPVQVIKPGFINSNAGPDFSQAHIKIGDMVWVGCVEIHVQSSQWYEHHHETDLAYDNVILHVVWKNDRVVCRPDGSPLPAIELRGRVNEEMIKTYRRLVGSSFSIPCRHALPRVENLVKLSMIERSMIARLERKADELLALHTQNGHDWEQTTYQILSKNFGFKVNSDSFLRLSRALPLKSLIRHADRLDHIEALLFGQAGFLDSTKGDDYFLGLRREYRFFSQKYNLQKDKMSKSNWKFLRLRPANFPTLRIAQLSALICRHPNLFSILLQSEDLYSLTGIFGANPSPYWMSHYQFSRRSNSQNHELGKESIENIIINTVIPVWVAYGKLHQSPDLLERALSILQQIPAEQNKITRMWRDIGIEIRNSFDSQGVIELYTSLCSNRNCLECNIGASLVSPKL